MDERLHEVRNSLSGIAAAADLLRSRDDIPKCRADALLTMITSEAARLERLVAAQGSSERERFSLDDVIAPVVTSRRAAGQPVAWDPSGHHAFANPDAIAECVNILLTNAAHHAPGSQVEVALEVAERMVCVRVSDDGPGVTPDTASRMFWRGERGPESPGEGLGLSTAQHLMSEQGGTIRHVSPADSCGTTFELWVPTCVLESVA